MTPSVCLGLLALRNSLSLLASSATENFLIGLAQTYFAGLVAQLPAEILTEAVSIGDVMPQGREPYILILSCPSYPSLLPAVSSPTRFASQERL